MICQPLALICLINAMFDLALGLMRLVGGSRRRAPLTLLYPAIALSNLKDELLAISFDLFD
jgi:hypothetical protein